MDYRLTTRAVWKSPAIFSCLLLALLIATTPTFRPYEARWWLVTGAVAGFTIAMFIVIVVVPHVKRMRQKVLRISEDAVEFPEGAMARVLRFSQIELVTAQSGGGAPTKIFLYTSDGYRVTLLGYRDMPGLLAELRTRLPAEKIRIL